MANNLTQEIISPFASYFKQFLSYMPNPDLLLETTNETLEIYRVMLLDARISSLLELRKSLVLGANIEVKPLDDSARSKKIAGFVKECLDELNLYTELKELLSALEFGFSVSEVVWELDGGEWRPKALYSRRQERFAFKPDGTLVLVNDPLKPLSVLNEPYKFIVHRHSPEAENPYGSSILKQCYWPWMFKKAGFRFWLTAAEKFGVPTVLAIFETDNEEEAQKRAYELASSLSNIQSDAAIALANVKEVETLEAKGDLADFKVLIETCNNEISYAITGQTLATAESKYGTRSQAEVHEEILEKFARADAKELAWTLNKTLIDWIVRLNFGEDSPVRVEFVFDDTAGWDVVRDAIDRGLEVSRSALYERFGIPKPKSAEDAFSYSKNPINLSDALKKKSSQTRPFLFG